MSYRLIWLGWAFFALSLSASAQSLFVADSVTKEPLPYAHVFKTDRSWGTYTGADGSVGGPIPYPVEISALGYKSITLEAATDTAYLTPKALTLTGVTVTARSRPTHWGHDRGLPNQPVQYFFYQPYQIATFIDNPDEVGRRITAFTFRQIPTEAWDSLRYQLFKAEGTPETGPSNIQAWQQVTVGGNEEKVRIPVRGRWPEQGGFLIIVLLEHQRNDEWFAFGDPKTRRPPGLLMETIDEPTTTWKSIPGYPWHPLFRAGKEGKWLQFRCGIDVE